MRVMTVLSSLDPKVMIWDVDGTLWDGVLDGDVTAGEARATVALLRDLADRGIVNTICSNNEPQNVTTLLERLGVLRYTVFEQINWDDKARSVARILEFFSVSPAAVVLVDDDERVRTRLAEQFGIIAVSPESIESADIRTWGRAGSGLRRLQSYRALQVRHSAAAALPNTDGVDQVSFLRSCRITAQLVDVAACADRIAELSVRSNQLNFTRSRLSVDAVGLLTRDSSIQCFGVAVHDRFGDYGLCGFVAVDVVARHVEHFFFSCRVLNQGVAEYFSDRVWSATGAGPEHPALVDFGTTVDWVTVVDTVWSPGGESALPTRTMRAIGGCDLEIIAGMLAGESRYEISVHGLCEVDGVQQYGHSSVELLNGRARFSDAEFAATAAHLPWIGAVESPRSLRSFDVVVLSLWVDYCSVTVTRRDDPDRLRAPSYRPILAAMTDDDWAHWVGPSISRIEFAARYTNGEPLTAAEIGGGLADLGEVLGDDVTVIVLNAPEIERDVCYSWGERQHSRNREVNKVVKDVVDRSSNMLLVDVAAIVTSAEYLVHPSEPTGFHYRRDVYATIASAIKDVEMAMSERR